MSLDSEISRIERDKQEIKDAIQTKGGTLLSQSLDTAAEEILALPTGGEEPIDWSKHPNAYLAVKELTSKTLRYVEDYSEAYAMLSGDNLWMNTTQYAFVAELYISPKAEELDLTYSQGLMRNAFYLTKIDGLRYLTKLTSISQFCSIDTYQSNGWPTIGSLEEIDQLPPNLTSIGDYFLQGQVRFNQPITISEQINSISSYFMNNCQSYSHPLVIPENVTYVGYNFMTNCYNFVGPLTVNTEYDNNDWSSLVNDQENCRAFVEGVGVDGENAGDWVKGLGYTSGYQWRNLYDLTEQPGDYGKITYIKNDVETTVDIPSSKVWNVLSSSGGGMMGGDSWPITIDGVEIQEEEVIGYKFGPRTSKVLPNYFLSGARYIRELEPFPSTLEAIGDYFMQNNRAFNSPLTFPKGLTSIGSSFLASSNFASSITLPNTLEDLGYSFLANTPFDQPIKIPASMTRIPDSFLYGCRNFNQRIVIGEWIEQIGGNFLYGCTSFNQPLTIPETVNYVSDGFLHGCDNCLSTITIETSAYNFSTALYTLSTTNSSAPIYEIGWTLKGTHGAELEARLPVRTTSPYRWFSDMKPGDWGTLVYDNGSGAKTLLLRTQEEFNALSSSSSSTTSYFSSPMNSVRKDWVREFHPGKNCLVYPDYFLYYCTGLRTLGPLVEGTTNIGQYFLAYCSAFNGSVNFPSSLIKLGNYCLYYCTSFNQPIDLSGCVNLSQGLIGGYFLSRCTAFNSELKLPTNVKWIDRYFLNACSAFNQPLEIPETLSTLGDHFLRDCSSFNHPIDFSKNKMGIDGRGMSLPQYGLYGCTSLASPVSLPDDIYGCGAGFMGNCNNFTGPLNVGTQPRLWAFDSSILSVTSATAPAYVQGITVTGPDAEKFVQTNPTRTTSPYRKFVTA